MTAQEPYEFNKALPRGIPEGTIFLIESILPLCFLCEFCASVVKILQCLEDDRVVRYLS